MLMLIMRNMTNSTMYIIQELHTYRYAIYNHL